MAKNDKIKISNKNHNVTHLLNWDDLYKDLDLNPSRTTYRLQIFEEGFLIWTNLYWHILLHIENKDRLIPLMQAVHREDYQMVSLLLKLGTNPNYCNDITRVSPLMAAIFRGNLEIANLLIKKGADTNSKDINERTILHHAVDSGKIDSVQYALKHCNNVNCQDNQGWTPLHRAELDNDIISLLISKGADKKFKDKNGFDLEKHIELNKNQNKKQISELQQKTKRFILYKDEKRRTIFPNLLNILDDD